MFTLISVLIIIVCILLVLVVLVQNSKGGGLAANFGASNQVMGVRRTTDFLEKATWTLAGALLVLSVLASWTIEKPTQEVETRMENNTSAPAPAPSDQGTPIIPTDDFPQEDDNAE